MASEMATTEERAGLPSAAAVAGGSLSGRQKAAVLLVSLGPERAAELLSHLHEEEIEALTLEMAKTRQVAAETTEAVMTEVVETPFAIDYVGHGGFDYARDVLEKSVGPARAAEMMGRLSAGIELRAFAFLGGTPPGQYS